MTIKVIIVNKSTIVILWSYFSNSSFERYQSSIIVFCPRPGLSLQTQDSPLYPLLSLPFRSYIQTIYHDDVYHLIYFSDANLLPLLLHAWRTSFSRQVLLSQWPSQFLFLFFMSFSIILPSPTLSSTTAFFIFFLSISRSILLHIHISNASSCFCSFRRSVQVSAQYNATLSYRKWIFFI